MPPTTGHLHLVAFARHLTDGEVLVLVCTQPSEPLPFERAEAVRRAVARLELAEPLAGRAVVEHLHREVEQDPDAAGFWDMWRAALRERGVGDDPRDVIVASERYGQRLADLVGCRFLPYDLERAVNPAKATPIRDDPAAHFSQIVPEFHSHLTTTVTVFGAESTGKTTLSRQLARRLGGHWLFEWARPFLEATVNEITVRSMTDIWEGQRALQAHGAALGGSPWIIQDTDLYSTVGYWQLPHWAPTLGECPPALITDAARLRSDLYVITPSNIAFEADPLRYGGDEREASDQYWIDVCTRFDLPHVVLTASDPEEREREALAAIRAVGAERHARIAHDRRGL